MSSQPCLYCHPHREHASYEEFLKFFRKQARKPSSDISKLFYRVCETGTPPPPPLTSSEQIALSLFLRLFKGNVPMELLHVPFRKTVEKYFVLATKALLDLHILHDSEDCDSMKLRSQAAIMVLETTTSDWLKGTYQDDFFSYVAPYTFRQIFDSNRLAMEKVEQAEVAISQQLRKLFKQFGLTASFHSRIKTSYSIFEKSRRKLMSLHGLKDILGFRIITESMPECYVVMDLLKKKYTKDLLILQDYIAHPKPSGYQSIHLNMIIKGVPVEFQIRDKSMDAYAERGPASHGKYKASITLGDDVAA